MLWDDEMEPDELLSRYECPGYGLHSPADLVPEDQMLHDLLTIAAETLDATDLPQSVCEVCELRIALDESGWSDIWVIGTAVIYGHGGYTCSATAFKKPHTPRMADIVSHLAVMASELQ